MRLKPEIGSPGYELNKQKRIGVVGYKDVYEDEKPTFSSPGPGSLNFM